VSPNAEIKSSASVEGILAQMLAMQQMQLQWQIQHQTVQQQEMCYAMQHVHGHSATQLGDSVRTMRHGRQNRKGLRERARLKIGLASSPNTLQPLSDASSWEGGRAKPNDAQNRWDTSDGFEKVEIPFPEADAEREVAQCATVTKDVVNALREELAACQAAHEVAEERHLECQTKLADSLRREAFMEQRVVDVKTAADKQQLAQAAREVNCATDLASSLQREQSMQDRTEAAEWRVSELEAQLLARSQAYDAAECQISELQAAVGRKIGQVKMLQAEMREAQECAGREVANAREVKDQLKLADQQRLQFVFKDTLTRAGAKGGGN
jgi:hypothetical protein